MVSPLSNSPPAEVKNQLGGKNPKEASFFRRSPARAMSLVSPFNCASPKRYEADLGSTVLIRAANTHGVIAGQ